MSRFSRRAILFNAASAAVVPAARAQDSLQAWLAAHAIRVRTTDPADENFSDLLPLAHAIGSARIVQLGEPSHGGGTAFAVKARLMKFLHQRLGFDVLIWESGLYDVALAQAAMEGSDGGGVADAARGIFTLWSAAAEVAPLFTYIKASQHGPHPIEMAGFDMQVTADGSMERFARDLRAFMGALPDPALRQQAAQLADQAIAARARLVATKFAGQPDLDALTAAVKDLHALIQVHHGEFDAIQGYIQTGFMDHAIENMRADAVLRFDAARAPTDAARESRRDAANAANLRWLLDVKYAGRKAVIWAHNAHVMNAYYGPDFHAVHLDGQPGDMKTTGTFLAERYGKSLYTIGMTAFSGEEGFAVGGPASPIAPAPDGSLEARLHGLNAPYAFVDLRGPGRPPIPTARIPKFDAITVADIGRIYDGVFFIDRMSRATHG
jgi:erythromycin esterase